MTYVTPPSPRPIVESIGMSPETAIAVSHKAAELEKALRRVIRGKDDVVRLALVSIFARGHLLIEGVPGVGKTTLGQALARAIDCTFQRVQFTSDMLPSDVLGISVYSAAEQEFEFKRGPVFTNVLLADEINRTTPKTQSALLEAMNEGQEQCGLRFRRGSVDLICQQHVGKYRAALEFELLLGRGIDRDAKHVGGEHVAGELHALEGAIDGASERLSESGLADSGNAFDEQVSAGEDADQGEADDIVFAANDAAQGLFQLSGFVRNGDGGLGRHSYRFYYRGAERAELPTS